LPSRAVLDIKLRGDLGIVHRDISLDKILYLFHHHYKLQVHEYKKLITIVLQNDHLFPGDSIQEILRKLSKLVGGTFVQYYHYIRPYDIESSPNSAKKQFHQYFPRATTFPDHFLNFSNYFLLHYFNPMIFINNNEEYEGQIVWKAMLVGFPRILWEYWCVDDSLIITQYHFLVLMILVMVRMYHYHYHYSLYMIVPLICFSYSPHPPQKQ